MKKVVLKVDLCDDRIKQRAMKTGSGLSGVESVSVDMKDKKLTLTGDIDAVYVVGKLRKWCHTEILSVGPAKEERKKEEPKKQEEKKDSTKETDPLKLYYGTYASYYQMKPPLQNNNNNKCYYARTVEEDPNGCVIC